MELLEWIALHKGDKPGHAFHGNQYGRKGGGRRKSPSFAERQSASRKAAVAQQANIAEAARSAARNRLTEVGAEPGSDLKRIRNQAKARAKDVKAAKKAGARRKRAESAAKKASSQLGTATKKLRTAKAPAQKQFARTPPVQKRAKGRRKALPNPSAAAVQKKAGIVRAQPKEAKVVRRNQMSLAERRKRMG